MIEQRQINNISKNSSSLNIWGTKMVRFVLWQLLQHLDAKKRRFTFI